MFVDLNDASKDGAVWWY